jgi:hypothetical protein
MENITQFAGSHHAEPYSVDVFENYSHPYRPSSEHVFDENSRRVKDVKDKGGGMPLMESKGVALPKALQYVNEVLKPTRDWNYCYSILMGVRTQQSPPNGPWKVRPIWQVSTADWILGVEALASALENTDAAVNPNLDLYLFHSTPEMLLEWYKNKESEVDEWVNLDWQTFDKDVCVEEHEWHADQFYPNYEYKDLRLGWLINATVMTPDGDLAREGAEPSGDIGTNHMDSTTNEQDTYESLVISRLDKFYVCSVTNGDDKSLGMSTKITDDNLEKIAKHSRRQLNVDKVDVGDYVWNSKWVICKDATGKAFITRPVYRVLNSTIYAERVKQAVAGSKEYVELVLAQQLQSIEQHPFGPEVIKLYSKHNKYHISEFSNDQLREAADLWLNNHNWMDWLGDSDDVIDQARNSMYGQESR